VHYRSHRYFLGLPLIHIAWGPAPDGVGRRGVAKGWLAVGDVAIGVVAVGGLAIGGLSLGGLAAGVFPIGGAALGVAVIGGFALGLLATGGVAIGWWGATGGLAIARDFAIGGVALAQHANDAAATDYFAAQPFFRTASWLVYHSSTLVFLPGLALFVLVLIRLIWRREKQP
jgi:hypothetical protein